MTRATTPEKEAAADAAYERGWVDSLTAHDRTSCQPLGDIYWYRRGWWACGDYRWSNTEQRGRAADTSYRTPRKDYRP